MKTLLSHRSIRKYQNRPIEKEILDEILKAVQAAPNWVNLQHISAIVVQEQQRREKFAELCGGQKHIAPYICERDRGTAGLETGQEWLPTFTGLLTVITRRYRKCWHSKDFCHKDKEATI